MPQQTASLSQPEPVIIYGSRSTPLVPRPSPKRNRAPTVSNETPTLPPNRRRKAPPLKPTNSFLFAGAHPLYSREVIEDHHDLMAIRCRQPGCKHPPKTSRAPSRKKTSLLPLLTNLLRPKPCLPSSLRLQSKSLAGP